MIKIMSGGNIGYTKRGWGSLILLEKYTRAMKIEQIYTGCLAQAAYYITSGGEAAVIDPLREIKPYIDRARKDGVKIKYVFETHFHADFVSGHLDLAMKTGATIVYGPKAMPRFHALIARDNQEFSLGKLTIKVLHTPGHTLESSCFLLRDESGRDHALFSGDTLFLGDVGRPDLAQKAASMSRDELAGLLYDSLKTKILPLADDVLVYPAHGAGSACGKNMMTQTVDTLGNQRKMNYALNQPDKAAFIRAVTADLLPPPGYFDMNAAMNRNGYERFETILRKSRRAYSPDELEAVLHSSEAVLLDTRDSSDFCRGFIPRSVNIGLKGDFAPWVGTLLVHVNQPLILITNEGETEEAITRLARVGFDQVLGYLKGGLTAWKNAGKETDTVERISAEQFREAWTPGEDSLVDVRKQTEYEQGHVTGALCRPLSAISDWFSGLDANRPFYLYCAGGYRSMIAASILKSRGIHHFREVAGGFKAIAGVLPESAVSRPEQHAAGQG